VRLHTARPLIRTTLVCGGCGAGMPELTRSSLPTRLLRKCVQLYGEYHRLQALLEAASQAGAAPAYGALRPLQRLAADAAAEYGACGGLVGDCADLLRLLYTHVAAVAEASADGTLPHTSATRHWPAEAPRDAVTLYTRCAQHAADSVRIVECVAARCAEGGGANCTATHPIVGGDALTGIQTAMWAATAAVRNALGGGPCAITPADASNALVSRAGMTQAAADALLAHMRRYLHVFQWKVGAHQLFILQLAVMLQAPLPSFHDSLLWCAACGTYQPFMPAGRRPKWCSGCRCLRFCSQECQAAEWRKRHRWLCKPLAELKSASAGGVGVGAGTEQS
jgi:MYND finger